MPLHQRTGWLPSKLRWRPRMLFAQAWEMECSSEEPFLSSEEEMDTDGVDAPKGRGAPGWTLKKGAELAHTPHPDQSNIARDIITMQTIHPSAPNYDQEVKKWRMAYRVPFPAFQVGTPAPPCAHVFGYCFASVAAALHRFSRRQARGRRVRQPPIRMADLGLPLWGVRSCVCRLPRAPLPRTMPPCHVAPGHTPTLNGLRWAVQKIVAIAEKVPLQAKKDPNRRAGR